MSFDDLVGTIKLKISSIGKDTDEQYSAKLFYDLKQLENKAYLKISNAQDDFDKVHDLQRELRIKRGRHVD